MKKLVLAVAAAGLMAAAGAAYADGDPDNGAVGTFCAQNPTLQQVPAKNPGHLFKALASDPLIAGGNLFGQNPKFIASFLNAGDGTGPGGNVRTDNVGQMIYEDCAGVVPN